MEIIRRLQNDDVDFLEQFRRSREHV